MNNFRYLIVFLSFIFSLQESLAQNKSSELFNKLSSCSELSKPMPLSSSHYSEKYVMFIRQQLDWSGTIDSTFQARVILGFKGFDKPTVLVTEGYFAYYAMSSSYEEELSRLLDANVIVCEHRYYGESVPESCNWNYLTVENSMYDLHHIREVFGNFFPGKWISTGISKGGQTTMFYRVFFPNDVDISVSYVAPLNKALEDGRHEPFLERQVGTKEERSKVLEAQKELLRRKESLLPKFQLFAEQQNYHYQASYADIYDYCVFELPFALWQWGTPVDRIPAVSSSDEDWLVFFMTISEPTYFNCPSEFTPFFVQAARELGYYGYSMKGLKKMCSVKSTKNYLRRLMLPKEINNIKFDKSLYKKTVKYLKTSDPRHIFIYGEIDPWSSSGVAGWLDCSKKENMRIYVQPRGSHTTRISTMPTGMYNEIMSQLTEWLAK